ncbi:fimbrial protein [Escherichia coli]|nr:fimbrial protein [Escherichia coli]
MKKAIMSLAVVSALFSCGAMAALNSSGQADNSASTATLNFTGKVTSSLCQVNTSDLTKTISLGEVTAAQLKNGTGRAPSQSFTVGLSNCDPTVSNITYVIRDANGTSAEGKATSDYLVPKSGDTTASGVGVYIAEPEGAAIQIGENKNLGVIKDSSGNALSEQTIALTAYIGTASGEADSSGAVTAGTVDATGVMTIKATAASADSGTGN